MSKSKKKILEKQRLTGMLDFNSLATQNQYELDSNENLPVEQQRITSKDMDPNELNGNQPKPKESWNKENMLDDLMRPTGGQRETR